jgi:hypothetical protein
MPLPHSDQVCDVKEAFRPKVDPSVARNVLDAMTGEKWMEIGLKPRREWKLQPERPIATPVVWLHFMEQCARPELVVHSQVGAYTDSLRKRDAPEAVIFATGDERMMGRCASTVNGDGFVFVTIADARVAAMRLAGVVLSVSLALAESAGGTPIQKKQALWAAVRRRIEAWPDTPAAMAPDLRLLAVNAPEPVVVAEDHKMVSVSGGRTIVRLASEEEARRALELAIWDPEEDDGCYPGHISWDLSDEEQEVLGPYIPTGAGGAMTVFAVCPNGANKGMLRQWDRRWTTKRGVEREVECLLFVAAGVIVPNLLAGLHSIKDRQSDVLLSTVCDATEEAVAMEERAQAMHRLRGEGVRNLLVKHVKQIGWRPGGNLMRAMVEQMDEV